MTSTRLALVVLAGPGLAALVLGLLAPLRRAGRPAALVALAGSATALVAAARLARRLWGAPAGTLETLTVAWLPQAGERPLASVGVLVDPLSASLAGLVALVAFLVQLYSLGYLDHETPAALGRYYLYQSLFAFSMLGLTFAPGFLQMFVFWELVGLSSYLLIGFWYQRPSAAAAAVKAFWVTKLGDLGFVVGIVILWGATGTFDFLTLFRAAPEITPGTLGLAMGLVYLGAMGKSAQVPLHVWLPDAMEGPTPVSALIHAATMVTAGVYLVARAYPLFEAAPAVLAVVAAIGALTAFVAATLALVQTDLKRVLAYSTVSQLGYMMTALGAGAVAAGFFHLITHGFFKALLFLGAGAVIHAVGSNDLRRMGRLGRRMPLTAVTFVIGALALAGVPPLAGFHSKEAVLAGVWDSGHRVAFGLLAVTALLTAFYMFRAVFLAFGGSGPAEGHPHDPPGTMALPLVVLALLAAGAGLLATGTLGRTFSDFLGVGPPAGGHGPGWLLPLSVGLAAVGIGAAWAVYQRRLVPAAALRRACGVWARAAEAGYGLDRLYEGLYRGALLAGAAAVAWIDRYLVDGVVNAASALTLRAGARLRLIQTGRAQDYLVGVTAGFLLLVMVWRLWP
jgi:NADH-quinone oxidoreductase subunit L